MTEEEMAERYADENKIIFEYQGMSDFVWQELKEAYLAGLKAGKNMNVPTKQWLDCEGTQIRTTEWCHMPHKE